MIVLFFFVIGCVCFIIASLIEKSMKANLSEKDVSIEGFDANRYLIIERIRKASLKEREELNVKTI